MSNISQFDLISGADIQYEGVCVIHPPHLYDIREIGYEKYSSYVSFLITDIQKYIELLKIDTKKIVNIANLSIFDMWISDVSTREYLKDALSFFISGDVNFKKSYKAFEVICNDTIGIINRNNYEDVVKAILQVNCIKQEKSEEIVFQDEASRVLYEQLHKAKRDGKLKSKNNNFNLANLIASVSACGKGYNLENVWKLTLYQLYDQFYRFNLQVQFDTNCTRWAIWGKEDFDFDVWYQDIKLLK